MRRVPVVLCLVLASAAPVEAQISDAIAKIIGAANLPVAADSARREGIPATDVQAAIDAMKNARVPADEAKRVLDESRAAQREHGPVDNFGAFVQARLAAGLRGRDLAAAIRAEHAARGKGRPGATKGRPDAAGGQARTPGRAPGADTTKGRGKSGAPDRPVQGGRPEGTKGQGQSKRPDRPQR